MRLLAICYTELIH